MIFASATEGLAGFWRDDFWEQFLVFLSLTFSGLGLGAFIAIPTGIVLARIPRAAGPMLSILGLVQTIPSLALLGFFVTLFQVVGPTVAIVCAVAYSIFPLVLNTYTGIAGVSPALRDSARGMGLTDVQILWKIELPLAMPVIVAGARTGAIYAIGVITICAMIGSGGLGQYVLSGMVRGDLPLTFLGIVPILLITLFLFVGLGQLAELAKKRSDVGLKVSAGLLLLVGIWALGGALVSGKEDSNSSPQRQSSAGPVESGDELSASARAGVAVTSLVGSSGSRGPSVLSLGAAFRMSTELEFSTQTPLKPKPSLWETFMGTSGFSDQFWTFLSLTMRGLGLALLIGLPIGVVFTRVPAIAQPIMGVLALVQTVPSLALLGVCVSLFGLFGPSAAIFATGVYSLFPIILNTYVGISEVDPEVRDAAKGMGMTDLQVLGKIELPLAMPILMAGIRTAAIYAIAMVTVCTLVGARGLGDYIFDGMATADDNKILLGVIPILLLSFVLFWTLSGITYLTKVRSSLGMVLSSVLMVSLAGYAVVEPWFRERPDVRVGSKNFTEGRILGEIIKQLLEHSPETKHLSIEMAPNLGSSFVYKSLRAGVVDVYPEYTGTLLTAEDGLGARVPEDVSQVTRIVRDGVKARYNLALLDTFGLNNTYALIIPRELAKKHDLRTISDLKRVPEFRVIVDQEFLERSDGWPGLVEKYDLQFETPPRQFDPNFLYRSLLAGKADVVVGYSTDWQIQKYNFVILQDDKNYFPSYHAAPLVRQRLLDSHPAVREVLNRLGGRISNAVVQKLNYEVAVNDRSPAEVAQEFLEKEGLIPQQAEE